MELREIQPRMLVWLAISGGERILCRVRFIARDFVCLQVVAATPEQVIACGYGVGEAVNSIPQSLTVAKAS